MSASNVVLVTSITPEVVFVTIFFVGVGEFASLSAPPQNDTSKSKKIKLGEI
jgi:hypothetical protein